MFLLLIICAATSNMHLCTYVAFVALATTALSAQVSSIEDKESEDDGGFAQTRCLLAAIIAAKAASSLIGGIREEQVVEVPVYIDYPVYVDQPVYVDYYYEYVDGGYYYPENEWEYEWVEYPVYCVDGICYGYDEQTEVNFPLSREMTKKRYIKMDKKTRQPISNQVYVRMAKGDSNKEEEAPPSKVMMPQTAPKMRQTQPHQESYNVQQAVGPAQVIYQRVDGKLVPVHQTQPRQESYNIQQAQPRQESYNIQQAVGPAPTIYQRVDGKLVPVQQAQPRQESYNIQQTQPRQESYNIQQTQPRQESYNIQQAVGPAPTIYQRVDGKLVPVQQPKQIQLGTKKVYMARKAV